MVTPPTQNLTNRVPIVDKDGKPTQYFVRLLQERGFSLDDKITASQATEIATEVTDEALTDHFVTAGVALGGGGTLISNPTIDLEDTAVTPGTYGDATNVAQITVDQQGRLTAVSDVAISGGGGGALTLLEQHTASSSASLDFTASITSTYDEYLIEFVDVVPATNSVDMLLQISTNAGSSYITTSYSAAMAQWGLTTNFSQYVQTTPTGIRIGNTMSNTAGHGCSATARFFNPLGSGPKRVISDFIARASDNNTYRGNNGGINTGTTAVDAFRIIMSSGNISTGTVRCYGIAK